MTFDRLRLSKEPKLGWSQKAETDKGEVWVYCWRSGRKIETVLVGTVAEVATVEDVIACGLQYRRDEGEQLVEQYYPAMNLSQRLICNEVRYYQAVIEQDGCCAICGRDDLRLNIDHDHETGAFRGLLCGHCNRGIGCLKDSPRALRNAADYIEKHLTRGQPIVPGIAFTTPANPLS